MVASLLCLASLWDLGSFGLGCPGGSLSPIQTPVMGSVRVSAMSLGEVFVCSNRTFCHLLRISVECLPTPEMCGPTEVAV